MKHEEVQANASANNSEVARDRVKTIAELAAIAKRARSEGKFFVLAHGVFDLLHLGHV